MTYVCFQSSGDGFKRRDFKVALVPADKSLEYSPDSLTADRGTQSEKKGPLYDVTVIRSTDEKQGCRNPGNGKVVDPSITHTSRSYWTG